MIEPRRFPCCICASPLEVRMTKKKKPYVICDSCGMQMFVRAENGIHQFDSLIDDANEKDIWKRLAWIRTRYARQCPECGKAFWTEERLLKMGGLLGDRPVGYRCPHPGCGGVAPLEKKSA